jgi:hypothetical protein
MREGNRSCRAIQQEEHQLFVYYALPLNLEDPFGQVQNHQASPSVQVSVAIWQLAPAASNYKLEDLPQAQSATAFHFLISKRFPFFATKPLPSPEGPAAAAGTSTSVMFC